MNFNDISFILQWWTVIFLIGTIFILPAYYIFRDFFDKGYIFSKILGLIVLCYVVYVFGVTHILSFSRVNSIILIVIAAFLALILNFYSEQKFLNIVKTNWKVFFVEESIFLTTLFLWSFVRAHQPDIQGLEKYMDFSFVNSILRSDYFPPKDVWYTPFPINYYYFGHLITAVLTKISGLPSYITFNLMLSTIFAFIFTSSFSIGTNLSYRFLKTRKINLALSGLVTAFLVTLGGNLTTVYAFFKNYGSSDNPVPFWLLPLQPFNVPNGYWYPTATRFIYHTIHEFPSYSLVVSDLHGHLLDTPIVLLTIATIFSLFNKKTNMFNLLLLSFLFAVMYMTNAWDGLIYFLLGALLIAYLNFFKDAWEITIPKIYKFVRSLLIVLVGFFIFSLPFNINFKPFVSGIGIICAPAFLTNIGKLGPFLFEANHCERSPIWQLALLYGTFYFFVGSFVIFLKTKKNYKFSKNDLFILMLIILSSILIITPELVYVKDIYATFYRANTMFKLVYEAFIMLSISSGYILVYLISAIKNKIALIFFSLFSIILLFFVVIYPYFAINSYYYNLQTYKGLDGISYLSTSLPGDYNLINWINKNIKGQPVILEANGDSYTYYARISSNTGLPTVVGWLDHEWLWRGTYEVVAPRITDVQTLYTTTDLSLAKNLIKKYNISYVVVSTLEMQKYPNLNENTFKKLGKLIYQSGAAKLYKINSGF